MSKKTNVNLGRTEREIKPISPTTAGNGFMYAKHDVESIKLHAAKLEKEQGLTGAALEKEMIIWYCKTCIGTVVTDFARYYDDGKEVYDAYKMLPPSYQITLTERVKGLGFAAIGKKFNPERSDKAMSSAVDRAFDMIRKILEGGEIENDINVMDDKRLLSTISLVPAGIAATLRSKGIETVGDIKMFKTKGELKEAGLSDSVCKPILYMLEELNYPIKDTSACRPIGGYAVCSTVIGDALPYLSKSKNGIAKTTVICRDMDEVKDLIAYSLQVAMRRPASSPMEFLRSVVNMKKYGREKWIPIPEDVYPCRWDHTSKKLRGSGSNSDCVLEFGKGGFSLTYFDSFQKRQILYTFDVTGIGPWAIKQNKYKKRPKFSSLELIWEGEQVKIDDMKYLEESLYAALKTV